MMGTLIRKVVVIGALIAFLGTMIQGASLAADTVFQLPLPGTMVHLSPSFVPAILKGIIIHPENGFQFDFIIHKGDAFLPEAQKRAEYTKLARYFLASLAIPDEDQWVNLSPYEKNRMIEDNFGKTEMGRDLLAQDYILKQITASLIYPKDEIGKKFWDKVYTEAQKRYGTTNIPVNTYNKVWILPDDALIYENGNAAYVLKNHLRVMLDQDYLAMRRQGNPRTPNNEINAFSSQMIREIVLPQLEREVNEGKNFAMLRQVYSGMLLATWYKRALKESLLGQVYANKAKIKGIDLNPKANEQIYHQYLKAYKKGVFNFIKEEASLSTHETLTRKYFSGGALSFAMAAGFLGHAVVKETEDKSQAMRSMGPEISGDEMVGFNLTKVGVNQAMARRQKKKDEDTIKKGKDLEDFLRFIINDPGFVTLDKMKEDYSCLRVLLQFVQESEDLPVGQRTEELITQFAVLHRLVLSALNLFVTKPQERVKILEDIRGELERGIFNPAMRANPAMRHEEFDDRQALLDALPDRVEQFLSPPPQVENELLQVMPLVESFVNDHSTEIGPEGMQRINLQNLTEKILSIIKTRNSNSSIQTGVVSLPDIPWSKIPKPGKKIDALVKKIQDVLKG
ncbi:MAG: hypothetical protein HQL13_07420, partial [Candidatus Omnitrophica bacterium]|nr:hypothetical protein [Candidatus Omnitrophota bacterium]